MKNRKAWGLVAVLAVVLLGGTAVGIYQRGGGVDMGQYTIVVLPFRHWGISSEGVYGHHGRTGYRREPLGHKTRLLLVEVRSWKHRAVLAK